MIVSVLFDDSTDGLKERDINRLRTGNRSLDTASEPTAMEVMEDLEKRRSASLNFLFLLSALLLVAL